MRPLAPFRFDSRYYTPVTQLPIASTKPFTPISAKAFRRQVLRPVEGVFLFHPRAMERLVRQHQQQGLLSRHVPALNYYLIPREAFLIGLEDENPEALSVIEGIDLPRWVILLPTPLPSRRITVPPPRLLYQYWARRFEAEVARSWQQSRDRNDDGHAFGPDGLEQMVGIAAMVEIREVLEREHLMVLDQDDATVVRQFVALITRQRFFAPALRSLWFPAIRDWQRLDHWLADAGLDLPVRQANSTGDTELPALLLRARPQNLDLGLQPGPELPLRLPYPCNDRAINDGAAQQHVSNGPFDLPCPPATNAPEPTSATEAAKPASASALQRFCLNAVERPRRQSSSAAPLGLLASWAGRLANRLFYRSQPRPNETRSERLRRQPGPLERRIRAAAFHRLLHAAKAAERGGHRARAIRRVIEAAWQYQHLAVTWLRADDPVLARLDARLERLTLALTDASRHAWQADKEQRNGLQELLHSLAREQVKSGRIRPGMRLVHHLEQAMDAARTDYLGGNWLGWLRSLGKQSLRQPLPHQSHLKALRALDAAMTGLNQLPWTNRRVEHYRPLLDAARDILRQQLTGQVQAPLDRALSSVGMTPDNHRQRVALDKLRAELLDVIEQRYHLRFSDVRDVAARNDLPQDDLGVRELLHGDRLTRLDRQLDHRLPGLYRRGELYLKFLHRLSSWLFGVPIGRLLTRFLLLPFGAALVILVVVDHVALLFASAEQVSALTSPWSVAGLGLLLIGLFHTRIGRQGMLSVWRGVSVAFTLIVFHGLRNLLNWEPVARLLRNPAVRELSRYLLEPLAIGLLILVPAATLVLWLLPEVHSMPWEVFALGFVVGSFLRNTQRGRRLLDTTTARLAQFWLRVRHTVFSGLFRLVVDFFKQLLDGFEQALYRLEELARYRAGESTIRALLKTLLRPIGASLSYLMRFYVTVLIEPQINPIKHFPVVTVSHKMMLPAVPALTSGMLVILDPLVPRVISLPFVTATVLLLPGFFGFLVWELKENWKLFSANRPDTIKPVLVGHHGETVRVMLRRGFHAGTVPKAFDRLRKLLGEARDSGAAPRVKLRRLETRLLQAQHAMLQLRDHELIASLRLHQQAGRLPSIAQISAGHHYMATSSLDLGVELLPRQSPQTPVHLTLHFSVIDGELQGSCEWSGPRSRLSAPEQELFGQEITDFFARCAAGRVCPSD